MEGKDGKFCCFVIGGCINEHGRGGRVCQDAI